MIRPTIRQSLICSVCTVLLIASAETIRADDRASATTSDPTAEAPERYEYRDDHDPNGIGKFYMGREIAHVMGFAGALWLERDTREKEERLSLLVRSLELQPGDVVADIGAGSGVISMLMAEKILPDGKVMAVDIQDEMLDRLQERCDDAGVNNVEPVKGTVKSPNLEPNSIDLAILVDVYHEFEFPFEMTAEVAKALKPGGRVAFVEYRMEDPTVPIKLVHKMTEAQVKKEIEQPEFQLVWTETIGVLPWQHIVVFTKQSPDATASPNDRAQEVTYFRDNHGLVGDSVPLPDDFAAQSSQVWRVPLTTGISSPCVHGDQIFLTTHDEESSELATVALNRATGGTLWTKTAPTTRIEEVHRVGSPAACTPACDGERVYSFFGSYGLLCYDLDGNLLWDRPLGPFQDEFGASSSPILVDDLVILNEDHDLDCFLVAFDRLTGDIRWKTPRDGFTRSYSSPILVENDSDRSIVVAGALRLMAYDIATGQPKWWVDGLSRIVDPTPVYTDGRIYIATWTPGGDSSSRISMEPYDDALITYDKDSDGLIAVSELPEGPVLQRFFRIDLDQNEQLSRSEWDAHARVFELAQNTAMAIRPGGTGDVTQSAIEWTYRRGLPTVPSSIVYDGILYMVKDSGIITTLDAETGELLKQGRASGPGNYYASLIAGDGKVYLASEGGVITVLKAGRDWSILSSHDFGERIMGTPAVKDGQFYLRTDEAMYCFRKN